MSNCLLGAAVVSNLPLRILLPAEGGGYRPPGLEDFRFPGLFGTEWLNKPFLQLVISAVLVLLLWFLGSRNLKLIPGKGQFFMESLYNFIRDGVAREIIGHNFQKYTGLLVAMFTFVLINNWFGEFFLFMFPTFSNIGYTWGVVVFIYITYIGAGLATHGLKYFKISLIPEGVPWYLWPLIVPIEFISNFITRPLTLAVRLFANMFAGHLSIMVFVIGGAFLLTYANNLMFNIAGGVSLIFSMAMLALEIFIGFLQAYIFTILTAQYISSSISDSH